jgi:solute carrier family 3, member 2
MLNYRMQKESFELEDTQKFLSDYNNNEVQFSGLKAEKVTFSGLSKEEIMKYGSDPTWVRMRWMLFLTFWLVWFTMLASAVVIVVTSPKCAHRPKMNWWQKEVVYQIETSNFKDSDGDGIGDINGKYSYE